MVKQLLRKQQEGSCLIPTPHPSTLMPCGQKCLPGPLVCLMCDFISFLVFPPCEETITACLPTASWAGVWPSTRQPFSSHRDRRKLAARENEWQTGTKGLPWP